MRHSGFQQFHECRFHVGVVIRDIQTNHPLVFELFFEPAGEPLAMNFLHHENRLRPHNQVCAERIFRIRRSPCRRCFHARPIGKNHFGGWAAQLVTAADKQDGVNLKYLVNVNRNGMDLVVIL
jgi:hypothetical protein